MTKNICAKTIAILLAFALSGSLLAISGCSQDTEVERTKLPYIDKPSEDIDASKAKKGGY